VFVALKTEQGEPTMKKSISKNASVAGISLALVFTFSCSSDGGGGDGEAFSSSNAVEQKDYCVYPGIKQCYFGPYSVCPDVGGVLSGSCPYSSSSSVAVSSSSQVEDSSSSQSGESSSSSSAVREYDYCVFISDKICLTGPMSDCPPGGALSNSCPYDNSIQSSIVYGTPVYYEGETYETVVIGSQTWFSRNLNYAVEGSKCYGEDGQVCIPSGGDYNTYITISATEIQANCDKYGRLYDWATAMGIPSSYNSSYYYPSKQIKYRGICPEGWHIPNNSEWNELLDAVGGSSIAGSKLKSNNFGGEDAYGFSALPGGGRFDDDGSFHSVGRYGIWWSTGEDDRNHAYAQSMGYGDESAYLEGIYIKSTLFSVRCLKD